MLYIGIIMFSIGIGFFLYSKRKYTIKKEEIYNILLKEKKEEIAQQLKEKFEAAREQYNQEEQSLLKRKNTLVEEIDRQLKFKKDLISSQEEQITYTLNSFKELKEKEINNYLTTYKKEQTEYINNDLANFKKEQELRSEEIQKQIQIEQEYLDSFKEKRQAINQAVLREKEIHEKENFYKVCLTEDNISDISILKQIKPRLANKEALNKLIYEVYIRRPAQEMVKRVLKGNSPSGIYKITYILTGESYIGRSTKVDKRWIEHIKTSMGIGSIAHSSIHTKMEIEGLWNFTFELLEEVPKEQLSEREKYYINLYDTKNCGMNLKDGG